MQSFVRTLQSLKGYIDNTDNIISTDHKDTLSVLLRLVNGEVFVANIYSHAVCGHHLILSVDGVIWKASMSLRERCFYDFIFDERAMNSEQFSSNDNDNKMCVKDVQCISNVQCNATQSKARVEDTMIDMYKHVK